MSQQNKIPETIEEYDAAIRKLNNGIASERNNAIISGILTIMAASATVISDNALRIFMANYGDWGRAGVYGCGSAISILLLARVINKASVAIALNSSRCEMKQRRDKLVTAQNVK